MSSNWTKLMRKLQQRRAEKEMSKSYFAEKKSRKKKKRKEKGPDMTKAVKIRRHYLRRFFYAFSVFFILFGILGIAAFVFYQDPDAFGLSRRYYQQGEEALAKNNLRSALNSFEKCLEIAPEDEDARLKAVSIYLTLGDADSAVELLDEGLALQPRFVQFYREKIRLLTSQNRISESLDYINDITATYILIKLNEERPASISSYPSPGTFTSGVKVTLSVPDGSTVYYTLDGTAPDLNSLVYKPGELISVDKGTVNIRAVAITESGMPGAEYDVSYRVYNDRTEYLFKDSKMGQLVRQALGKISGAIYYKDLEKITVLDMSAYSSRLAGKISSLDDLLEMPNLVSLNLDGEDQIPSVDAICRLTKLKDLSLDGCGLTDEDLLKLTSMVWLDSVSIAGNKFTSLAALSAFSSVEELDVSDNGISAMPSLAEFARLKKLDVSGNALTTLSWISNQKTVASLDLSNNLITDLTTLATCPALTELNVASNLIETLAPLAGSRRLASLDISGNAVTSLNDLQNLTGILTLTMKNTQVTSLAPLVGMTGLTTLNVSGSPVTDFTVLADTSLRNLYASGCGLEQLTSLVMLRSLEILDVSGNSISDITSVSMIPTLNVIDLSNNYVADFTPLLNCSKLLLLKCAGCGIPEAVLTQLTDKGISIVQ
ncbi:MAG: leucine-rich repeat domain-containing protein [Clostridia bacterium]|nr:leucine-rich repeat domain-containing protein [Clostridia bacterium]